MPGKDFKRYAYFNSKARDLTLVFKPRVEAKENYNTVIKEPGERIEFSNHMLRIEKTEDNEPKIAFIRERVQREVDSGTPPEKRTIWEELEPVEMMPKNEAQQQIDEKNAENEELKKMILAQNEKIEALSKKVDGDEKAPSSRRTSSNKK